jgi:hypothetical protein
LTSQSGPFGLLSRIGPRSYLFFLKTIPCYNRGLRMIAAFAPSGYVPDAYQ